MDKNPFKNNDPVFRYMTLMAMLRGNATIEQTTEVQKLLHEVSGLEYDEEKLLEDVSEYYELHILGENKKKRSIQTEVENWLLSNASNEACYSSLLVSLLTCYSDLSLKTKEEKAACRMAFQRLVKKGTLEPDRNRSGMYRYLNGHTNDIDFINADDTPFEWRCPLNTHELVNIYPRSVVIIAGESNSGKTAYMLNVAKKYKDDFKVNYFSSEMEDVELKVRLKNFNRPLEEWKSVRFIERVTNFNEVIMPDEVNIIDYLEVHKDFYEVSGLIRTIRDKLNKGIVVIAIQKPAGRDEAVGGAGTKNLARLYISLSPGRAKIVKGKIWRTFINPDGMYCNFKLGGGANFKISGEGRWVKDEAKTPF